MWEQRSILSFLLLPQPCRSTERTAYEGSQRWKPMPIGSPPRQLRTFRDLSFAHPLRRYR